jgi:hypothetical protein
MMFSQLKENRESSLLVVRVSHLFQPVHPQIVEKESKCAGFYSQGRACASQCPESNPHIARTVKREQE